MSWFHRLGSWLSALAGGKRWTGKSVEDLPDGLTPKKVYAVGQHGEPPWAAAFLCPCGCKEMIQLSLIGKDNPSWRADFGSWGRVTLHPSVWRVRGCRSHFFVRDGRIIWAKDGRPRNGRPAVGRPPRPE